MPFPNVVPHGFLYGSSPVKHLELMRSPLFRSLTTSR